MASRDPEKECYDEATKLVRGHPGAYSKEYLSSVVFGQLTTFPRRSDISRELVGEAIERAIAEGEIILKKEDARGWTTTKDHCFPKPSEFRF